MRTKEKNSGHRVNLTLSWRYFVFVEETSRCINLVDYKSAEFYKINTIDYTVDQICLIFLMLSLNALRESVMHTCTLTVNILGIESGSLASDEMYFLVLCATQESTSFITSQLLIRE